MKNLTVTLVIALSLSACGAGKLDMNKAKACTDGLLNAIKAVHYDELGKYYSSAYNESESAAQRTAKLNQLTEKLGAIQSYQLVDSARKERDEAAAIVLTYKVQHAKITTLEKFVVIKDEGEYRIMGHDIQSGNQE